MLLAISEVIKQNGLWEGALWSYYESLIGNKD